MDGDISPTLVRRLLAAQFPQWADLPIMPVHSAGTDNAIFQLGSDLAVRMPRRPGAAEQVDKEYRWLPKLAPHLPLAVPVPLAKGAPGAGYLWGWTVCRWLEGQNAVSAPITDQKQAGIALAQFLAALRRCDTMGGPPPGSHNFNRGEPLINRDAFTRESIASLPDTFDKQKLTVIWEAALQIPQWQGAPVWIHGDLQSGNLLVQQGRLSAVIDWGGLGVGDPACDVAVGWSVLSAEGRQIFRAALGVDDVAWVRGRAWALSMWAGGVAYYAHTHPEFSDMARRAVTAVMADYR